MNTVHIEGESPFIVQFHLDHHGCHFPAKVMAISRNVGFTAICFAVAYLRDALMDPET